MQFHKLILSATLTIAAAISLQPGADASTKYESIIKQLEPHTAQMPMDQPELATKSMATNASQPTADASTRYESIIKQLETHTAQMPVTQPEVATKSLSNQEGQTFFSKPPMLIRAASSQLGGYVPSVYEFTLTVPKDAGQPLKAVTIAQLENSETVEFDVSKSKAYFGERFAGGPEIRLASVGGEQSSKPGDVTISFDQPVQPGSTITVALAAKRNPSGGGVYLFGVTAYPAGDNGLGQFLGYGRINFYSNSN